MNKEQVTEELVRQNGNQAAAVMADYASQGGGGGVSAESDLTAQLILAEENNEPKAVYQRNVKGVRFGEVSAISDGCGSTQYSVDVFLTLDVRVTKLLWRVLMGAIHSETAMPTEDPGESGSFEFRILYTWQH